MAAELQHLEGNVRKGRRLEHDQLVQTPIGLPPDSSSSHHLFLSSIQHRPTDTLWPLTKMLKLFEEIQDHLRALFFFAVFLSQTVSSSSTS